MTYYRDFAYVHIYIPQTFVQIPETVIMEPNSPLEKGSSLASSKDAVRYATITDTPCPYYSRIVPQGVATPRIKSGIRC